MELLRFLFKSFCMLTLVWIICEGEKNETATSFKVAEGKDLDITCNATRSAGWIVYWTKNETKSTFRQNGTILRFVNIRRGASGDYICHLQTDHNITTVKVIKVDVQYPAEIERFSLQPTTIKENETFSIVCKMAGNPDPVWSIVNNRSERQMMTADAPALVNLTFWPVTWEDAGVWKCTGYNYLNQGQNATRAGIVTVLCSPKPVIINQFKYYVHKGQPALLIMNTNGCPSVQYTWTHNGIVLPQNRHVDGHWHSTVNISHTREADFGIYELNMSNPYGNYVQQYELIHAGEKNETATSFKVAEGKDLDITCNATRSTGGIVFWTKNETKSTFRQNGTILRFVNIRRGASGDYICHLQTDHNTTIVKVIKVDVQYPAEIERFSLQPTTIKENETFSIVCKMAGNPDPVWSIVNNRSERQMMTGDAPALVNFTSWPVTWEDAGVWKCTGYNYLNQGQNATRAGSVTVLCSPKPVIINQFKYYVHKGQPALLIMNTNGCPSVQYTWTHNGIVLPQNRHVDGHWHSTVNLSHTSEEDFGIYQLNMSNPYGNYVQQYELIHAASPTPATSNSPYTGSAVITQGHNLRALIFLTVLLLWL